MEDQRHSGTQYLMYWAATEPSDPDDSTDPAYDLVGKVRTWRKASTNAEVPIEDKDGSATLAGSNTYRIEVSCNSIAEGDAGQQGLKTAHEQKTTGWWLKTDNVEGHEQERGRAQVLAYTAAKDNNAAATDDFTLAGVGAYVREDVPALST